MSGTILEAHLFELFGYILEWLISKLDSHVPAPAILLVTKKHVTFKYM